MKTVLVIAGLLTLLGITVGGAIWAWQTAGVEMSGIGYAAMFLGILFTILLGCGLMGLMFYSSRHGYDEAATDLSQGLGVCSVFVEPKKDSAIARSRSMNTARI